MRRLKINLVNGRFIDPKGVFSGDKVTIEAGKIIQTEECTSEMINLNNYYITPGFIDSHVHIFENRTSLGLRADQVGIEQGVTTIIDAGSSGYSNFKQFKEEVIEVSKTNIKAFLNIANKGLTAGLSELADTNDLISIKEGREILAENSDHLVGFKARMSSSVVKGNGVNPLISGLRVAEAIDVPIMVHIGNPPPYLPDIFPLLRKGDIVTHAFHGKKYGLYNTETKEVHPEALAALKRGVHFDIGHGSASFSYDVFKHFINEYKNISYSASTDIHNENVNGIVGSLMNTLSKMLALGVDLKQVIQSVTSVPSEYLKLRNKGSLREGADADFTIFDIVDSETEMEDAQGVRKIIKQTMIPKMTIVAGEVVWKADKF